MIFLRFWGCPLSCPWCDELRHRDPRFKRDYSLAKIVAEMDRIGGDIPSVVLTGGEPLAAPHLSLLVDHLKGAGKWLAMESSGVGGLFPSGLDWLTLSPKSDLAEETMMAADELKFVVATDSAPERREAILQWADRHPNVWIQPQARGNRPDPQATALCLKWVLASRGRLRLSTQIHKYLGIP